MSQELLTLRQTVDLVKTVIKPFYSLIREIPNETVEIECLTKGPAMDVDFEMRSKKDKRSARFQVFIDVDELDYIDWIEVNGTKLSLFHYKFPFERYDPTRYGQKSGAGIYEFEYLLHKLLRKGKHI